MANLMFDDLHINAKVIYPLFIKWGPLNKKGIDYLSIRMFFWISETTSLSLVLKDFSNGFSSFLLLGITTTFLQGHLYANWSRPFLMKRPCFMGHKVRQVDMIKLKGDGAEREVKSIKRRPIVCQKHICGSKLFRLL